jgi:hypothetical protein
MEYRNLDWAAVGEDEEMDDEVQYVDIVALSETGDFQPIDCPSKVKGDAKCRLYLSYQRIKGTVVCPNFETLSFDKKQNKDIKLFQTG